MFDSYDNDFDEEKPVFSDLEDMEGYDDYWGEGEEYYGNMLRSVTLAVILAASREQFQISAVIIIEVIRCEVVGSG